MAEINKIYSITLEGEQELLSKMNAVNKAFDDTRSNFKKAQQAIREGLSKDGDIAKEKENLNKVTVELLKQQAEAKRLRTEAEALKNAKRALTNEELKQQQATQQTYSAYQQLQKQYLAAKKEAQGLGAQYGTNSEQFQRASAEAQKYYQQLVEIDKAVGVFTRNVGNYPKTINLGGISSETIQSLKNSGLGEVIASQINQAKSKVGELDKTLADLKNQLNIVKASGSDGFERIEKEIIENRREAEQYRREIERLGTELSGVNGIGKNFAAEIRKNFAEMKGQLTQFALGYLSFQGAMQLGSRIKDDVIAFDSYNQALEKASTKTGDFAQNQKFVEETAERLGLKILDTGNSFKLFFSAFTEAGGAAQEARNIFEAASEAAATMKLSQEQANGVMLAFSQIASKGKVQAEELRGQIGERIPGAFGIAAKAMGVTTAELDDMMKDGKLMAQDFLPKFAEELKKTYGNGGKEVKGLRAELNRLDNLIAKIGSNKTFITTVSSMITAISVLAQTIGKIPWKVWLTFVTLLTLAYWENIRAMVARNAQLAVWIVRQGVGNALIITATAIERAHAVVLGIVNMAYRALIATMELLGISTAKLRAAWIAFNALLSATPWGIIIGLIAAAGGTTMAFAQQTESSTKAIKAQGQALLENKNILEAKTEIERRQGELISGQMSKIKQYTAILDDNTASQKSREEALKRLIDINPQYLKGLTLENYHTAQGVQILEDYKNKLLEVAKAKGAKDYLESLYAQQWENESTRQGRLDDMRRVQKLGFWSWENTVDTFKSMAHDVGIGSGGVADKFKQGEKDGKTIAEKIKYAEGVVKGFAGKGMYDQTYIDSLLGSGSTGLPDAVKVKGVNGRNDRTRTYTGAHLSGEQKDALNDMLAAKENEISSLKEKQQRGLISEENYWKEFQKIVVKYRDQIINYLNGADAKERKITADQRRKAIDEVAKANDELYNIGRRRIESTQKTAEKEAQNERDKVLSNIYSTEQEKIQAEQNFQNLRYQNAVKFSQDMIDLNLKFNREVKEETEQMIADLEAITQAANATDLQSVFNMLEADSDSVDRTKERLQNQNELNNAIARRNILGDKRLNQQQKEIANEQVSAELELANTNAELGAIIAKLNLYDDLISSGVKLTDEYQKQYEILEKQKAVLEEQKAKQEVNLNNARTRSVGNGVPGSGFGGLANFATNFAKNNLGNADGKLTYEGTDITETVGYAIAQGFDMAQQAMSNYFDTERQRIEQSKQLAFQRIELQREQQKRYAQSKDEENAIDREAEAKKRKAEKEAGERLKKNKRNEARIAFLMELANIWSSVWSLGNPIAAAIMGGVLSALATARYAMTVSNINKIKYERGGVFGRGGKLTGPSHHRGGLPVINPETGEIIAEMEGDEAVINRKAMADKNTYTVSGTPAQIASRINRIGGGIDWYGGATMKRYEQGGIFNWNRAKPPVFRSQLEEVRKGEAGIYNDERLSRIEDLLEKTARESTKRVMLNPNDVTGYQRERDKQTEIGTL